MDTAYTSRKMWFGLRFILEESPIQKSFLTWSGRLVFEPEFVKTHTFPHTFCFCCLIFFVGLFHDFFNGTLRVLQIKLYAWKGNKEVEIRCDGDTRPYAEN